jgi:hypothetical protein
LGDSGYFDITSPSLTVQVSNLIDAGPLGNEHVAADAVRIELITPFNNEPVIDHIGLRSVRPGQTLNFQVAIAADPDSKLFRLQSGPPGASINPLSGVFSWTAPATPGDYAATVEVIDYGTTIASTETFTIRVLRPEEAYFADPDVERAVRNALLARPEEEPLLTSQLTALKTLRLDSNLVDSLEGLQHATGLESLHLQPSDPSKGSGLTSLDQLSALTNLETLAIAGVAIPATSLSALSTLTSLQSLDLRYNGLTTLANLPELPALRSLDLRYNHLDLSSTSSLPREKVDALTHLYLYGNSNSPAEIPGIRGLLVNIDLHPVDLERATTVVEVARALHYLPIDIFEYVVNNFEFQPYYGLMKGPQATLDTKAGNAWDLSALLIELLQTAYETTTHVLSPKLVTSRVFLPNTQTTMDWLGVRVESAAQNVLLHAGLNQSASASFFDHAFVEATFPGSSTPLRLDASWKFKDYRSGIGDHLAQHNATTIIELVPFNQAAKDDYLSVERKELAYEWYENKVQEYLNQHLPGTSIADVGYDGPIRRQTFEALPPGLPVDYSLLAGRNPPAIPSFSCRCSARANASARTKPAGLRCTRTAHRERRTRWRAHLSKPDANRGATPPSKYFARSRCKRRTPVPPVLRRSDVAIDWSTEYSHRRAILRCDRPPQPVRPQPVPAERC